MTVSCKPDKCQTCVYLDDEACEPENIHCKYTMPMGWERQSRKDDIARRRGQSEQQYLKSIRQQYED